MAPWFDPDYKAADHYEAMKLERYCWACFAESRPRSSYFGPWIIERAHIVNKPRREDARLVVMLCTICHKISHGERFSGFPRPKLELHHLLKLKWELHKDWFDLAFMQKHSVRILPAIADSLPVEYLELRLINQPWRKPC